MRQVELFGSASYVDRDEFFGNINDFIPGTEGVFHQGACSSTTHPDPKYVMDNNFVRSRELISACYFEDVPIVYASSAAVYGSGKVHYHFTEDSRNEQPLNVYGYSKLLTDNFVRGMIDAFPKRKSAVIGLRYFNVYGPGEEQKGGMASVAYQLHRKSAQGHRPVLYGAYDGYDNGEHRRDFVFVDDVVHVNLHFMFDEKVRKGIFNVGTGVSRTFNELAMLAAGECPTYDDFPEHLKGKYQCFTEADIRHLREAGGYHEEFKSLEEGLKISKGLWRV